MLRKHIQIKGGNLFIKKTLRKLKSLLAMTSCILRKDFVYLFVIYIKNGRLL